MKVIYYAAASLDGFIADRQHAVRWLDDIEIDHPNSGCAQFFNSVDALIMGRRTFDFVYDHGTWPYEVKPTWVCSGRDVPSMKGCNLQPERDPAEAIEAAGQRGFQSLWMVGGGQLAASLIRDRLLTHVSISVMPVLLGEGISLISTLPRPCFLTQESSKPLAGFTQVEFKINY